MTCLHGCDPLEEQREGIPEIQIDGGWEYPNYLVIGGGISETLSLLTVNGPDRFSLANDVQVTASAINQTVIHNGELYAVCSSSNSIVVYDVRDLSISRELSVSASNNPMALAFYGEKKGYISNFIADTVTYYDLSDDRERLLATIPMPTGDELPNDGGQTWARPGGLAVVDDTVYCSLSNLDGSFVAGGPGLIAVIDAKNNFIEKLIELEGRDTVGVLADGERGLLYAISAGDYDVGQGFVGNGLVEIVDTGIDEVTGSVPVGGAPFEMVLTPEGIAYLVNGREALVLSFDTRTLEVLDPIDIRDPDDALGLSFASGLIVDGHGYLYALEFNHDRLFVVDTNDQNRIVERFSVNDGPDTLSFIQ